MSVLVLDRFYCTKIIFYLVSRNRFLTHIRTRFQLDFRDKSEGFETDPIYFGALVEVTVEEPASPIVGGLPIKDNLLLSLIHIWASYSTHAGILEFKSRLKGVSRFFRRLFRGLMI